MKKNVAVFFGGKSNEHDISIITGIYAVNLLRGADYKVIPVYLPREGGMCYADAECVKDFTDGKKKFVPVYLFDGGLWSVKKKKQLFQIDVALNCCHGGAGEDGTLSALLKWNAISSVFMNKWLGKIAARGLDLPVARAVCVKEGENVPLEEVGGYPVIVKPVNLGSSIGIKIAHDEEELASALRYAFRLDGAALVEESTAPRTAKTAKSLFPLWKRCFRTTQFYPFTKSTNRRQKKAKSPPNCPKRLRRRSRATPQKFTRAFPVKVWCAQIFCLRTAKRISTNSTRCRGL